MSGARAPALTLRQPVLALLPGLRVVVVVARGLRPEAAAGAGERWSRAWAGLRAGFAFPNAQSHPHVARWREAMRAIGAPHKQFPSSVEALVRRALKAPEPFRVHPLVDFYNAVSLEHVVPAGGFDLAGLDAGVELRATRPGDTFHALDAEAPEPVGPGEVAYASGTTVLTRHLVWRQSRQALFAPTTREAVLVSEVLAGQDALAEPVRAALADGLAEHFAARVHSAVLDADHPSLALDP
jgi:DNA/RNA-binding domain of Phe-tRNA-synthetase-like protein